MTQFDLPEPQKFPDLRDADYRDPVFTEWGTINVELNHPVHGWIPFHATPDDVVEYGREIFKRVMAAGNIAPYVAPPYVESQPSPEDRIAELEARLAALESRV